MKKRVTFLLALAAILIFAAGAMAGSSIEAIQANLAHDIKFVINGESWEATDGGVKQSPIIYNGRTYLPVRSLGEALGIAVDWDDATRTVYLGEKPAVVPPVEELTPEQPAAELAISPTAVDYNKNTLVDIPINITWGSATKITEITGSALNGAVNITPKEGSEYTVVDNGDGTGLLTIKSDLTKLLPLPITMVPDGTVLTLTIKFDNGEQTLTIKVVS